MLRNFFIFSHLKNRSHDLCNMASYCFLIIQHAEHEWINNYLENACHWILTCLSSTKARKKEVPCFTQKFSSNSQKLIKFSPWMSSHTNKNLPWITYKNKHCFHQFCLTARHYSNVSCRENPLLHCLCTRGGHKSYKAQNVDTYKQTNKTHYILQYTAGSLPPQGHNWLTSRFLFFLSPPCGSILSFLLLSKQITRSPIHQWISILFKNQFFKPIH